MIETKNAIIKNATLSTGDHGCLSAWINLDYGGTSQGFGGYNLYSPSTSNSKNYAGVFIWRVLEIVGVSEWSDLIGMTIRVRSDHSKVYAIGHIVKDIWFNPSEEFEVLGKP